MNASCLKLDSVTGQLTCHACVSRQNVSCAWAFVAPFAELPIVFFLETYDQSLISVLNFVIVLINWKQDFMSSTSVGNHPHD